MSGNTNRSSKASETTAQAENFDSENSASLRDCVVDSFLATDIFLCALQADTLCVGWIGCISMTIINIVSVVVSIPAMLIIAPMLGS